MTIGVLVSDICKVTRIMPLAMLGKQISYTVTDPNSGTDSNSIMDLLSRKGT